MILKTFSLFDRKAGAFMTPFFMPSRGQAVRALTDLVSDPATTVARHPGDFALFELGSFDDALGRFSDGIPDFVTDAGDCIASTRRQSGPWNDPDLSQQKEAAE